MKRVLLALCLLGSMAHATTPRGDMAPKLFQQRNPCPSTGKPYGACPGYIKDHICPLRCNCPDTISNLQWQTKDESDAKDKWEGQCWRYERGLMHPLPPAITLKPPVVVAKQ